MVKIKLVCLICRHKFKHKPVEEGGTLYCPYCNKAFLMQNGKIYIKKYTNENMPTQAFLNHLSDKAREEIEEQGALNPPSASEIRKQEAKLRIKESKLMKKGKSDFKCIYCGFKGGEIANIRQIILRSQGLPADTKIVRCPECKKCHITDGKRIYSYQTKKFGPVMDRMYEQI